MAEVIQGRMTADIEGEFVNGERYTETCRDLDWPRLPA
jgi:hypothetical protein